MDAVAVTNLLYEQNFECVDDVKAFFSRFRDKEEAVKEIAHPQLFILDNTVPVDPLSQLEANEKESTKSWDTDSLTDMWHSPERVFFLIWGRMVQANDILQASSVFKAHPLIQAPVSFHWLSLKLKANRDLIAKPLGLADHLELSKTNALLAKELRWLGNVPLPALIELRKKGQLRELRALINQDLNGLSDVPLTDLEKVTNQIDISLSVALERHQEKVEDLNRMFRNDMATSVPTLLLSLTAALQPVFATILPAWTAAAGGVVGATQLKEVVSSTVKFYKERKTLGRTPVGILWQAKKRS
jgi:hypothetical protein